MNLNLASLTDLIKSDEVRSKGNDDKKKKPKVELKDIPVVIDEPTPLEEITDNHSLSILSDWWIEHKADHSPTFKSLGINSPGLNPNECIVFVKPDPSGGLDEEGNNKIVLVPFLGANKAPVLNLRALEFNVFNNGYMMIHELSDTHYITTYGSKTNINLFDCLKIEDSLIPYNYTRLHRTSNRFPPTSIAASSIVSRLETPVDSETLVLMYKQSIKFLDDITTTQDAVNWLLQRKVGTVDINHLIQLDQAIIQLVNPDH